MLGYDAENNILVISTLTQPGGVMAIRVELPSDERRRKAEEQRIIESLRRAHTGFMRIDGLALYDMSSVRKWSIWALVWGVIIAVYLTYYRR
jgi:hypothetical protein